MRSVPSAQLLDRLWHIRRLRQVTEAFDGNGSGPAYGIADHLAHLRLMVDGERFVAGRKVEDFAAPAAEAGAAAQDFPALIPMDKNQRVGLRDVEVLPVRLGMRDLEIGGQSARDRMAWRDAPDTLLFAHLAPGE